MAEAAIHRIRIAYRPSTRASHRVHFSTYLAFVLFMDLPLEFTIHSIITFLEYLFINQISYKVMLNYMSSLRFMAKNYHWDIAPLESPLVGAYLRSIKINFTYSPTVRGVFDINMMHSISAACDILSDPPLFRAAFLIAFFAFLRMSNIAPHSKAAFDPYRHILRQDVLFLHPGAHILLKWTKTLQDRSAHHFVQIPNLKNPRLCPVRAIKELIESRPLHPQAPLFVHKNSPYTVVIDTTIRAALKTVLTHLHIPIRGHGFHSFRRSGATMAFDNNVQLQHIMAHGLWRSSAVWQYLQNASVAPSIIPLTFAKVISS